MITIMTSALTIGQKTTCSNWIRHSLCSQVSDCGLNPHVVYDKTITGRPFYIKQSSLY